MNKIDSAERTIVDTHTVYWPTDEHGRTLPIDFDELREAWARRTGQEHIRRNWQHEGIADVLDVEWLRAHIHEFDDDALISILVDCTSFSGDADLTIQADIAAAEIWTRDALIEGLVPPQESSQR